MQQYYCEILPLWFKLKGLATSALETDKRPGPWGLKISLEMYRSALEPENHPGDRRVLGPENFPGDMKIPLSLKISLECWSLKLHWRHHKKDFEPDSGG